MKKSYSTETLSEMKADFDKLKTVEEKLGFWRDVIKFRYTLYYHFAYFHREGEIFDQSMYEFHISCRADEYETLGNLILEEIKLFDRISHKKRLVDFEQLKEKIEIEVSAIVRPIPFLKKELLKIDEMILEKENLEKSKYVDIDIMIRNGVKNAWIDGFFSYYYSNKDFDIGRFATSPVLLEAYYNGYEIAIYKAYLEEKIKNPIIKKVSSQVKETSLIQQLLILKYTGVLDSFLHWNTNNRTVFFGTLLNRSNQKVKVYLNHIDSKDPQYGIWTETNLEFLINHFQNIGLLDKAEMIKIELEKLKIRLERIRSEK